jgi:hypothetical protein
MLYFCRRLDGALGMQLEGSRDQILLKHCVSFFLHCFSVSAHLTMDLFPSSFRSVSVGDPVTRRGGVFVCELCSGVSWHDYATSNIHRKDPIHCDKVQTQETAIDGCVDRATKVNPLLLSLRGSQTLADPIRSQLLAYLFDEPNAPPFLSLALDVSYSRHKIQLALLELKLWKTACILHPAKPLQDMVSVYFWMSGGWKSNKQSMRHHELITVVLENVMPFLGGYR